MLKLYVPSKSSLRSADKMLLCVPKSHLVSCGDKSFVVAAPKLWNALPYNIKSLESVQVFKTNIKTYLFSKAFFTS